MSSEAREEITIRQVWLGHRPYVLVEFKAEDDDGDTAMSSPKKWIEATSIDQIKPEAEVKTTGAGCTVRGRATDIDLNLQLIQVGDQSSLWQFRGRRWFVRNPDWVKPASVDKETIKVLKGEVIAADEWIQTLKTHSQAQHATIEKLKARIAELEANQAIPEPEPVMPEEPPVGAFFKVDRSNRTFYRANLGNDKCEYRGAYPGKLINFWYSFDQIVKPGDEIELLELRPVGEDK